jgi:Zn finger protein HypA/HybF involved in hydrogenase expression
MTESEALKILNISPEIKKEIPNLAEVYEVAVKALEKQIPKKPSAMESTNKLTNGYFECPVCKDVVGVDDMQDVYCPNCGQKLDWK